jgi:hypothetical protein
MEEASRENDYLEILNVIYYSYISPSIYLFIYSYETTISTTAYDLSPFLIYLDFTKHFA